MASKRKTISAVIAVALTAAILLGGTFAWQSISQEALNEVYGFVNPGGRLHDDFHEITAELENPVTRTFDKNVYVENFTTVLDDGVQIFARIRLDEYMEVGKGAGDPNSSVNQAESVVLNATLGDKTSWRTHIPGDTNDPFHDYWDWTMAGDTEGEDGSTYYMPTFNKNKDSLAADVNGSFAGADGNYRTGEPFDDYVKYSLTENHDPTKNEIHDADDNDVDELTNYNVDVSGLIEGSVDLEEKFKPHVTVERATHYADETLTSKVITMADWLNLPDGEKSGNYWVWDIDGWAYWANPIDPSTATGVFLDGIARTPKIINEDWYYGINVVAQFITVDDLGKENNTGFYADGETVSSNALKLLSAIGVKVNTEVSDAETLNAALAVGGNVTILNDTPIEIQKATAPVYTVYDNDGVATEKVCNFATNGTVTNGTTLSGGALMISGTDNSGDTEATYGLFLWTEEGNGSGSTEPAVVENMTINNTGAAKVTVYSQALTSDCVMNDVIVSATNAVGIVSEHHSDYDLVLNDCIVTQSGVTDDAKPWTQAAVVAWGNGSIIINGGEYQSTDGWAAYVYSSSGKIVINDGVFTGKLGCDAGELIIKGGTFSVDPSQYVADGYKAVENGGTWTVTTA